MKYNKKITMKMEHVDSILGNIILKHEDKWRGNSYLKEDFTFTVDRSLASRFYLLKSGNTTIINGDNVTINIGNKILIIVDNTLNLVDRDEIQKDKNSVIITDGTDDPKPIAYNSTVFFIVDKNKKTGLKQNVSEKKLTCDDYAGISDINSFKFILEKVEVQEGNTKTFTKPLSFAEANKGMILMILLIILLVLSILAGK